MFQIKNIIPRSYQENILKTALEHNTLVVLPTGMGKTAISLLLSIKRLNKYPLSKVLICSPTKPLCQQHLESFKKYTNLDPEDIVLFTGSIAPKKRIELIESSKILIATPQTIQSDIKNNRLSLKNFSLLTIDEAHRSRQKFANTIITKDYRETSQFPRILALTASPGGTKEKINEIINNLFIDKVEIRTENDEDILPYIQKRNFEWVTVELSKELKELHTLIKNSQKEKLKELKKLGYTKPTSLINKKDLLDLQRKYQQEIKNKNQLAFYGISLVAQLMKLSYCLELLETQTLTSLQQFFNKQKTQTSKAAKIVLDLKDIQKAISLNNKLIEKNIHHPKIEKLISIIKEQLSLNKNSKIILFTNYRDTVDELLRVLNNNYITATKLIGQKDGYSQKQQISTIKEFENHSHNVLITTSIGEEGLDIRGSDIAIFYDNVSTSIRKIQRAGRVARLSSGKIIFLITKNTIDEAYYWKAKREEKSMQNILYKMQNKEHQKTL
ncbi:MAG: DEAD/DEAH box helicase [Nanoarchaeota archaeon]|nr:DEAD/DEAH box helicase [Nanoarchaeota archaeon]